MTHDLFIKKNKISVIPSGKDYEPTYLAIEVKRPDGVTYRNNYVTKSEYLLALKIRKNLTQKQIDSIINEIDDFASTRYSEGYDEAAINSDESY